MDEVRDRTRDGWRGLLVLLVMAAVAVAYWIATAPSTTAGPGEVNGSGSSRVTTARAEKTFGVSVGTAPAIHPGQVRQLPVTWTNPNSFAILVESYSVSVDIPAESPTTCPAWSLRVSRPAVALAPRVEVPRNGSATSAVEVGLPADAPESCKSVPFTVTVDATAVKK